MLFRSLSEKYPTPFVVISLAQVERNYDFLKRHMPRVNVYYAMKANPAPRIIETPVDLGVLSPFRVATTGGRRLEADTWFRAYGASAATGFLGGDYDEIRRYDGTIRVDEHLRVVGHPGVWAIGDITDVRETKRADAARAHARVVAANIRSLIGGGSADAVYALCNIQFQKNIVHK